VGYHAFPGKKRMRGSLITFRKFVVFKMNHFPLTAKRASVTRYIISHYDVLFCFA
jgi:hypothetical protein